MTTLAGISSSGTSVIISEGSVTVKKTESSKSHLQNLSTDTDEIFC